MDPVEKLSPEDFKALREYIYSSSGLFFSDAKLYFVENRISKRLQQLKMSKYQEYLRHIKQPGNKQERFRLFDAVTTNETSFYRNPPQIDAFSKNILPKVVKALKERGQKTLKIWSSACSSGEEPYTLAMVLDDRKELLDGLNAQIHATDISQDILQKVREGSYQSYTMRNLSATFKDRYFVRDGSNFKITDKIKKMVIPTYFNLVDYPGYVKYRNMDVIFCRNVLIYFDVKVKREIIKSFYQSLGNQGYLLIGHSESLHNINKDFKLEHFSRALAYLKPN